MKKMFSFLSSRIERNVNIILSILGLIATVLGFIAVISCIVIAYTIERVSATNFIVNDIVLLIFTYSTILCIVTGVIAIILNKIYP